MFGGGATGEGKKTRLDNKKKSEKGFFFPFLDGGRTINWGTCTTRHGFVVQETDDFRGPKIKQGKMSREGWGNCRYNEEKGTGGQVGEKWSFKAGVITGRGKGIFQNGNRDQTNFQGSEVRAGGKEG